MDKPINKERLRGIKKILNEIACGNFNLRYTQSELKDELEAVGIATNMLSENLESAFLHQNYFYPSNTKRQLMQLCFIIDNDYNVIQSTRETFALLQCKRIDIIGKSLYELTNSSRETITKNLIAVLKETNISPKLLQLDLCVTTTIVFPARFTVSVLDNNMGYLLSSFETVLVAERYEHYLKEQVTLLAKKKKPKSKFFSNEDKVMAKKIAANISKRINKKLDSIDNLALEFGTNSTHLRAVFKKFYGVSIRYYHREKRLILGRDLLMSTDMPIKNIADSLGFTDPSHFSHVFKKRYDYTPWELRKYALSIRHKGK